MGCREADRLVSAVFGLSPLLSQSPLILRNVQPCAPHVAQNTTNRASAIDGRTTRHPGYAVSQIIRKRIEESFAWTKTIAGLHKTKHRGVGRVAFQFVFAMAAYNLIRMPRLLSTAA